MKNPLAFLVPELPPGPRYGALGRFVDAKSLYRACERVRDAGYTRWDAHTPFPVQARDATDQDQASRPGPLLIAAE